MFSTKKLDVCEGIKVSSKEFYDVKFRWKINRINNKIHNQVILFAAETGKGRCNYSLKSHSCHRIHEQYDINLNMYQYISDMGYD